MGNLRESISKIEFYRNRGNTPQQKLENESFLCVISHQIRIIPGQNIDVINGRPQRQISLFMLWITSLSLVILILMFEYEL